MFLCSVWTLLSCCFLFFVSFFVSLWRRQHMLNFDLIRFVERQERGTFKMTNITSVCRQFAPCRSILSRDEYLNITQVHKHQEWLTTNGMSYVEMQRTCDAAEFSAHFDQLRSTEHIVIATFALFCCLLSLVTNFAIILVTNNGEILNGVIGVIRKNLALSDMLLATLVSFMFAVSEFQLVSSTNTSNSSWFINEIMLKKAFLNIQGIFLCISLCTSPIWVTFLTLSRCISLAKPMRYEAKKLVHRRRTVIACSIVWILLLLAFLYPVFEHWIFFRVPSKGPYLAIIDKCVSLNGKDGSWLLWTVLSLGCLNALLTGLFLSIEIFFVVRRWNKMSRQTKDFQINVFRMTAIHLLLHTAPSILYMSVAGKEGIITDSTIVSTLLAFCFIRCNLMFFIYYFFHKQFEESLKYLLRETIPRKSMQFKARYGCLDLN